MKVIHYGAPSQLKVSKLSQLESIFKDAMKNSSLKKSIINEKVTFLNQNKPLKVTKSVKIFSKMHNCCFKRL